MKALSSFRRRSVGLFLGAALFALPLGAVHAQTQNKDLLLRSSYNVTFGWKTEQKKKKVVRSGEIYLLAAIAVQNLSGGLVTDLVIAGTPPEGFEIAAPPEDLHLSYKQYVGYEESFDKGSFSIKHPTLRHADSVHPGVFQFFVKLIPDKQPFFRTRAEERSITKLPLTITYTRDGDKREFKTSVETAPIEYGSFSGLDIEGFLRMFSRVSLDLDSDKTGMDWTFFPGRADGESGVVAVQGGQAGKGYFRLQAWSHPDRAGVRESREILVRWQPQAIDKIDEAFATRMLEQIAVPSVGKFKLQDVKPYDVKKIKFWRPFGLTGRWDDSTPAREVTGPFRFFIFRDFDTDFMVYLHAQVEQLDEKTLKAASGDGVAKGEAGAAPADEAYLKAREEAVMEELIDYGRSLTAKVPKIGK